MVLWLRGMLLGVPWYKGLDCKVRGKICRREGEFRGVSVAKMGDDAATQDIVIFFYFLMVTFLPFRWNENKILTQFCYDRRKVVILIYF